MTVLLRLIDSDERSLARRVAAAQQDLPDGCVVTRFTYWYTSRPRSTRPSSSPLPPEPGTTRLMPGPVHPGVGGSKSVGPIGLI